MHRRIAAGWLGGAASVAAFAVVTGFVTAHAQSAAENAADLERLAAALHVDTGSVMCEVGAGSGELTIGMARRVGESGRVYSNDLNPDRRAEIAKAATSAALSNVSIVEGQAESSNLPLAACDGLFMRSVYHHFANPAAMNRSLFASIKPGGYIAIIDFAPAGPESTDPAGRSEENHHGVSAASVVRELGAAGFTDLSEQPVRGHAFLVVGRR
jgi:ubiquinone/menaquinone biosynthesis C-methylase UbiE